MSILHLAFRNVWRNKFRVILTILGVSIAIVAFVLLRTVISAWEVAAEYAAKDRVGTRHKVSFVMSMPKRYIDIMRDVEGVESATWACWFGGKDPKDPNNFFATIAVDPQSFLQVYDEVSVDEAARQRWLEDRQGALIGDVLARKQGWKVGDRVTLLGTIYPGDWQFRISGIYQATRKSMDRSQFLFHYNYMNDSIPERRRDQIGWMVARIGDPSRSADIARKIDQRFDTMDVQTLTMSERAMNLSFLGMFSAMLWAMNWISLIILLILLLILGNTIAMGVRERTNEYGVLRALGFLKHHVATFIFAESAFIGIFAGITGVILSYFIVEQGMGRWLEEYMGGYFPYFRIEPETFVAAIVAAILLGILAAGIPALRASRLTITNALRRLD